MIEAYELVVARGDRVVIESARFQCQAGTIVALLGRNGAGKTSLLEVLAGIVRPSAGQLLLNGAPLTQMSAEERARQIAFLTQDLPAPFPLLVEEVVILGRYPHRLGIYGRTDWEIAQLALHSVGAGDLIGRSYRSLSGGERQRVQLARVLTQIGFPPKYYGTVLLLDEPANHLDLHQRHNLFRFLAQLARKGLLVVAAVHDLDLVWRYADQVIVLHNRTLLRAGPPSQVLANPDLYSALGLDPVWCPVSSPHAPLKAETSVGLRTIGGPAHCFQQTREEETP